MFSYMSVIFFYIVCQKLLRPPEKSQMTHTGGRHPQVENHWTRCIEDRSFVNCRPIECYS